MKHRKTYRAGVRWIALNDDWDVSEPDVLAGTLTVTMLADLFGTRAEFVASDVLETRYKIESEEATGSV